MVRCGDFFKKRHVIKDGDFSPRHTNNYDEVSDEESKALTNFTALVQQQTQKKSIFTMKATYQWALHELVIEVVLFVCASYVANNLQMPAMAPAKLK
jgi:hypothetical protein